MQHTQTISSAPYLAMVTEGTLYLAVLAFILFSLVLGYHVQQYSLNKARAVGLYVGYVIGGVFIMISMYAAYLAI